MDATLLRETFANALPYDRYLATDAARAEPWHRISASLTPSQRQLLQGFVRHMPVLVLSGIWCGDCAQQGPMLQAIAQGSPRIDLRWIDRDQAPALRDAVRICGGHRVPTVIWMAEDFEFVSLLGDRTLPRYRSMASRQLGPSCPLPGAALPADEAAATLQAWLDEFERVQLLLRLSGRLRQRHGD
jgi:thiol-disulfide isomerase/thioredoxin